MKISIKNKCFWTLTKNQKIKWLRESIANWEKTIANKDSDSRYTSWSKAKDKRDCLNAWIGAMNQQKQWLKQLLKK